jgi:cyclophilin family peptidyl-prolyl cis-trans isomerase
VRAATIVPAGRRDAWLTRVRFGSPEQNPVIKSALQKCGAGLFSAVRAALKTVALRNCSTRSKVIASRALAVAVIATGCAAAGQNAGDRPVVVVETVKGSFSFETYPGDVPWTTAHVLELVRARFYDGQRIHRAQAGFVIQFGDPQTKDPDKRAVWGRGPAAASGKPIGAAELSKNRRHLKGAVGMSHLGDPAKADSQIYITLEARPDLDGRYAVFGQVIDGMDVVSLLQVGDEIQRVYLRP